ncbi:hypothetical protein CYMTET_10549 [Cymbomonas tetramitiformis]|uniref:Peptidase S74 domain-containing protein n=1 Tax=Cymbomonas tetramitiformis TaxID=36881 RepID=A0AAE0GPD2_9CHLO|nr:hypothetical protein CYMTET_10549 [Cymbomonas tetramitiformis]
MHSRSRLRKRHAKLGVAQLGIIGTGALAFAGLLISTTLMGASTDLPDTKLGDRINNRGEYELSAGSPPYPEGPARTLNAEEDTPESTDDTEDTPDEGGSGSEEVAPEPDDLDRALDSTKSVEDLALEFMNKVMDETEDLERPLRISKKETPSAALDAKVESAPSGGESEKESDEETASDDNLQTQEEDGEHGETTSQGGEDKADLGATEKADAAVDEDGTGVTRIGTDGVKYTKVGDEWLPLQDPEVSAAAKGGAGGLEGDLEAPTRGGKPKASDLIKVAREAARDAEKRKDPEVKRLLRQYGVDASKLTVPGYLNSALATLRTKAAEMKEKELQRKAEVAKAVPMAAYSLPQVRSRGGQGASPISPILPQVRSRGGQGCGVCTNGTGGNFAKGLGMVIGGGAYNTVMNEKDGYATIGGGRSNKAQGEYSTVAGGYGNLVTNDDSTCAGGGSNKATAAVSTVVGGNSNEASGLGSTVGGGANNVAAGADAAINGGLYNKAGGDVSVIGGGEYNTASSAHSTVGGGVLNSASHDYSTVVGGMANAANFNYSTVAGGGYNVAGRSYAVVGGGYNNTASGEDSAIFGGASNTASGKASVVAGGDNNTASSKRSFAAGHLAMATHPGSTVFADSTGVSARSSAPNQFVVQHSDVRKPGGGAWMAPADRRTMKTVEPFTTGLSAIQDLKPMQFEYSEGGLGFGHGDGRRHIGLVAQDVESVDDAAFMVSVDKMTPTGAPMKESAKEAGKSADGHRAVDPSALTYMLLNAVNELSAQVAQLQQENKELR